MMAPNFLELLLTGVELLFLSREASTLALGGPGHVHTRGINRMPSIGSMAPSDPGGPVRTGDNITASICESAFASGS